MHMRKAFGDSRKTFTRTRKAPREGRQDTWGRPQSVWEWVNGVPSRQSPTPLTEPYVTVSRHTTRVILYKFNGIPFANDKTLPGCFVLYALVFDSLLDT
jgi:hypothetical protein